MADRFQNVEDKLNFSAQEENVLKYWAEIDAFKKSLQLSEGRPEYTFYDGPPFATGLPHYGYDMFACICYIYLTVLQAYSCWNN